MKPPLLAFALLLISFAQVKAADEPITWLVHYEAKSLPQEQGWKAVGELAAKATLANGALHLVDDSATADGAFRAAWKPQPGTEIVVEATVRVESVTARRGTGMWPAQQGVPVGLLVSDGVHQEGLLLRPEKIATYHDRVAMFDAKTEFHTYQLVIRDRDMSIAADGKVLIRGEGAFWKKAENAEAFVQFGSTAPGWMGDAHWKSVRLGLRKRTAAPPAPKLKITVSEPWDIPPSPGWDQPRHGGHELKSTDPEIGIAAPEAKPGKPLPPTRPYLYNVGNGVLMLSVAQGPDAIYEPYGVLRSADAGKTWQPVKDLQFKTFAPQPHLRLPDGDILGVSRWNVKYEPGTYVGMSYRFDAKAEKFLMVENVIHVPTNSGQIVVFDRDICDLGNGEVMAVVYTPIRKGVMSSYLLKSTDAGATWNYFSTIGDGPEPSVVRFSSTEMMAILRTLSFGPLLQTWSHDGGKTWSKLTPLEEGSVAPDMVLMSNGVVACSYGRPGSNLMFSTDQGKTWTHHTVITDSGGFNYTAIREVSPGRLLYIHDAPKLRALYVDVERINP
ncbi:MAG: sialidase family protein [Chthoniobacteraceae bacterium]